MKLSANGLLAEFRRQPSEADRAWSRPDQLTVAQARAFADAGFACLSLTHPGVVRTRDVAIDATLSVRIHWPRGRPVGVLLWLHGGGFFTGSLDTADLLALPLAAGAGCVTVSVGYPLAPEHPFPAGLEASYAALRWLEANRDALELGDLPIVVGGDSAGGALAAGVTLLARDRGGPTVAFQVLLCPMASAAFDGPSRSGFDDPTLAGGPAIAWLWRQYLADDGDARAASPLLAESLAGLPNALVVVAELDALRDEGIAYAERLAHEAGTVDLRLVPGVPHNFFESWATTAAGRQGIDEITVAIRDGIGVLPED